MGRKQRITILFAIFLGGCWMAGSPLLAQDTGLVDLLSSQLGITQTQAQGGAGSIFQAAKQNLSAEDFASVAKAVPGMNKMLAAAPKIEKGADSLGGLSSMLGDSSKKLGSVANLASSFKKLGLSGDMVGQFTPIILNYVKQKGGEVVMNLLKGALP
jgi:Protein of unknown function VcgC/VcgE (DUF2780)